MTEGAAWSSPDGRYRYALERTWAPGPRMLWVLGNPSRAYATADDPTLRRCVRFARDHGCGGVLLANLWAWRATHPRDLAGVVDPVGPDNDRSIAALVARTDGPVVLGWGVQRSATRVATVLGLLGDGPRHCLGRTRDGHPRHPLYVSAQTGLSPW
ncbi:DUF1643 domain-containing protein [Microlunatus spumicola]|uniref:DUF1643 domain-containing protein n=1 Tax=Microlunatus spumicola TaxID=81499 RepID=A0ABP6WDG6_9ACTN